MVIAKPLPGSLWIGLLLLISGCQAADDRYWYGNKQAILPGNLECEGEFDGLVHVSAMATQRVGRVSDVVSPDDKFASLQIWP